MHYFMFGVYLAVYAAMFKRCKPRYIPNGMWRQGLCVTRLTICPKLILRFTSVFSPFFSKTSYFSHLLCLYVSSNNS